VANTDASSGGKGEGGLVGFLIVTAIALVVGGGFGFFLDGHLKSGTKPVEVQEAEPGRTAKPKAVLSSNDKLVALAPVVANLAEPSDTWIRIEASILVGADTQGADTLAAKLAEDFVAYLRTATLNQFEGASGFQNLRDDLKDRARIREPDRIKDVIVHGVVIE